MATLSLSRSSSSEEQVSVSSFLSSFEHATSQRATELAQNLEEIRERILKQVQLRREDGVGSSSSEAEEPILMAVSKYKPAGDVMACYEHGQRDFGENYAQELVDKAKQLPRDIRWHFIGTLQTNKARVLAAIPNLYAVQTLSSIKAADALNRALPVVRDMAPLNVLLQVNTSGEDSKSGLQPLVASLDPTGHPVAGRESSTTRANDGLLSVDAVAESELGRLAEHINMRCPRLRLQGLMTIGALSESLAGGDENHDFEVLKMTRDNLEMLLRARHAKSEANRWGVRGRLLLSMGMSSDFEPALRCGSDIVRVGTGIFGQRHRKGES